VTQHRIVRHTSEALATALEDGVKAILDRSIQVVTGPPVREKFTRLPALGAYLYRVAVLSERREELPTLVSRIEPDGTIRDYYQDPPLILGLDYMVSAWADDDAEQQELIGAAMRALAACPTLEGVQLEGDSFDPQERIPVRAVEDLSVEFLMSMWRGFGEHLRPAVAYRCRAALHSPRRSKEQVRVADRRIGFER
jgi:hypothetical protein